MRRLNPEPSTLFLSFAFTLYIILKNLQRNIIVFHAQVLASVLVKRVNASFLKKTKVSALHFLTQKHQAECFPVFLRLSHLTSAPHMPSPQIH